jgi:hypothetical protein
VTDLLDVSEVVLPQRPYHSITITFAGVIAGGKLAAEADHPCGEKVPRWFSTDEIRSLAYHPTSAVEKALGMNLSPTGA